MINSAVWLTLDFILIFIVLTGGFFMFRAFLRRMKNEEQDK